MQKSNIANIEAEDAALTDSRLVGQSAGNVPRQAPFGGSNAVLNVRAFSEWPTLIIK
jgi:hypothetical protein